MNQSEKLMRAFQYVDDELLTMAEKTKKKKRKKKKKKSLLSWGILAACLALVILLPVTAIAKNWFGLRDLFVPDYILEEEERQDTIGLSGYMESAEAQALREWNLFLQEYDKDRTILKALGNKPGGVDKRYSQYLVYTEEMAQKLEEILQKYDLEPHLELFKLNTLELVTDFAQKFVKKGNRIVGGYIYNDGTFQAEGVVPIDGCGMVSYQLRRVVKGVFDDVTLNIGRKEDYTEIPYRTGDGEDIVLALGKTEKSLIFADLKNCFVTVNILYEDGQVIMEENLRALAEAFDFQRMNTEFSMPEGQKKTTEQTKTKEEQPEPPAETEMPEPTETADSFYGVCTAYSAEEVEVFADKVRELVLAKDWEKLGEFVSYPVRIGEVMCESQEEFAKGEFEQYLDEAFYEAIEKETCREMFCNWQGIMMGDGEIWIAPIGWVTPEGVLRVISINP